MATREGGDRGRHQRAAAAEHDLLEVAHQRLAERDGVVQIADALVHDAHRVTAVPWAMGAKTTGVARPPGPRPHPPPGRERLRQGSVARRAVGPAPLLGPGARSNRPQLRRQLRVEVGRPPGGRGEIHPAGDEVNCPAVDERPA